MGGDGASERRSPPPGTGFGGMFPLVFAGVYVTIDRGEGPRIWDDRRTRYLDAIAGNPNANIGHGVAPDADLAATLVT